MLQHETLIYLYVTAYIQLDILVLIWLFRKRGRALVSTNGMMGGLARFRALPSARRYTSTSS